jgi:monoamine oxidase
VARSEQFRQLTRLVRAATVQSDRPSTGETPRRTRQATRREFIAAGGAFAASPLYAARRQPIDVAIVGAGIAGLACADELTRAGFVPVVYEASTRAGGRCHSLRGFFPGQVAERGGEFVDNLHKTMLRHAKRFGLAREDVTKAPGDVAYFFGGQHVPESTVVDEFRGFVPAMRHDLRDSTGAPTADEHNAADVALDNMSLADYLVARGASPLLRSVIEEAYVAEYGLDPAGQSALNFLLFIHADRRSKFTPFGVFSDERFHLVDGNDGITTGLAAGLPRPIEYGRHLTRVRRRSDGHIELTFGQGAGAVTRTHEAVVLTLPFSVLRQVDLHASLGLPSWKRRAIDELGYGTNAKMMIGFSSRPWVASGSDGTSYSDLPNCQTTWETNPSRAAATRAILTDYSGGARGAGLRPAQVHQEADRFLMDVDRVYPGARAAATETGGLYRVHLEHWPSNPLTLGSYTCYTPGQFTTIAGNEAKPIGNLFFAGEHANSFYEWQGFMEGAALSGIAAAAAIRA